MNKTIKQQPRRSTIHLKSTSQLENQAIRLPLNELKRNKAEISDKMAIKVNKSSIRLDTLRNEPKEEIQQYFFNKSIAPGSTFRPSVKQRSMTKQSSEIKKDNRLRSEISIEDIKEFQFKELMHTLTQQNLRLKKELNTRQGYLRMPAEELSEFLAKTIQMRRQYQNLKKELNFYQNEVDHQNNSILKVLLG